MQNENGSFIVEENVVDEPKRRVFSPIVWGAIVLFVIAAGVTGYYFYDNTQKKETAKVFLRDEGESFSKVISEVNTLTTDKDITDSERGSITLDVVLGKISDEELKVAKALDEVRSAKKKNEERKINDLVKGVDGLLDGFYPTMETQLDTYHTFLQYCLQSGKSAKKFMEDMDKARATFNNLKTDEDVIKMLDAELFILKRYQSDILELKPSPGMEDEQKKSAEYVGKLINMYVDLKTAVQEKNGPRIAEMVKKLGEFPMSEDTRRYMEDSEQREEYYFNREHSRFVDLQKKADAIKTEILRLSFDLKVSSPTSVTIEGW